ncbi:MAG TPA: YdeI/OmpD-associated family protein [Actinomycetota bacterium]|jgi:uncharacterized protein YdeI (YjbR/CyaY-like superfamily)|nr:YdeI/OmpD-associated family protein [Actinomycetota bacterium]
MVADEVVAKDRAAWRRWLERHHASTDGVWLIIGKKGSRLESVTYEEAVEEALCFGWIDAKANRLDDRRYKQWMARRKPGSGWAESNKRRVERLIAEGRMAPAGLAAIEAAKADGSWSKLDRSRSLEVPADLAKAMRAYPDARRHFDAFPPSARRMILYWIDSAKRPETRSRRIEETARLAQENVRANESRPRERER